MVIMKHFHCLDHLDNISIKDIFAKSNLLFYVKFTLIVV